MRRFVVHAAWLAGAGAAAGAAVVFLGLFNVSAQLGHLPAVGWLLHTAFRSSVELRAPPADAAPPAFGAPDLVALGARHYDQACRVCHGAPGEPAAATMRAMVPHPPPVLEAVRDWTPPELFWIVKHGVKMTGMPHWPAAERDDDVWAVASFLDALKGLKTAAAQRLYRGLLELPAPGDGDVPMAARPPGFATCAVCHGWDGSGRGNGQIPRIDILSEAYIRQSLLAYRAGERQSGVMRHAASLLDDGAIAAMAVAYASAAPGPAPAGGAGADAALAAAGRALATGEPAANDTPVCAACHGPWPRLLPDAFPSLDGQSEPYLRQQLELWRDGRRGGLGDARLMHVAARELDDAAIRALAAFYASRPPGDGNAASR